jgi:hypothetical protein
MGNILKKLDCMKPDFPEFVDEPEVTPEPKEPEVIDVTPEPKEPEVIDLTATPDEIHFVLKDTAFVIEK